MPAVKHQLPTDPAERIQFMNDAANGFGATLLDVCAGDINFAISVGSMLFTNLFANWADEVKTNPSIHALVLQKFEGREDIPGAAELFDEAVPRLREAIVAFEAEFTKQEPVDVLAEPEDGEEHDGQ